ncbi:hypothetical protein P5673_027308, partial [Acropora cervicornis]
LKEAGIDCPVVTIRSTPSCCNPPEDISGTSIEVAEIRCCLLRKVTYRRGLYQTSKIGSERLHVASSEASSISRERGAKRLLVKMTQEIGIVEAVEGLLDVSANPVG